MTLVDFVLNTPKLTKKDFREEKNRSRNDSKAIRKQPSERLEEVFSIIRSLAFEDQENGSRAVSNISKLSVSSSRAYIDKLRDKGYIKKIKRNRYAIVREYL